MPPRNQSLTLPYPVRPLLGLPIYPSILGRFSQFRNDIMFTGQQDSNFEPDFFLFYTLAPLQEYRPLRLCAVARARVCVIGSKRSRRSSSPTKTTLGLKDREALLPDVGQIFHQIHPQECCFSTGNPSRCLSCPARKSIATLEGAKNAPHIRCCVILTPSM